MRLSYLDILLSTATIFVVLFGVMNRRPTLSEAEGKALVLYVVVPRRAVIDDLTVRVTYHRGGETEEVLFRPSDEAERGGAWPGIDNLTYYFRSEGGGCRVRVGGQPDPGSAVEIVVEGRPAGAPEQQAELRVVADAPKLPLGPLLAPLDEWAEKGVGLAISTGGSPRNLDAWLKACPEPGADRLLEYLRDVIRLPEAKSVVPATVLAYGLVVHDALHPPAGPLLPSLAPDGNEEGERLRTAVFRAARRLAVRWGPDSPILSNGLPKWYGRLPPEANYFPTLPPTITGENLAPHSRLQNREMGPFAFRDYRCHRFGVVRVDWMYGDEAYVRSEEWGELSTAGRYHVLTRVEFPAE